MMRFPANAIAAMLIFSLGTVGFSAVAQAPGRIEAVRFPGGTAVAKMEGQIKGDAFVDYRVRAGAGQTLSVELKTDNPQNYFNVLPPGNADAAMFIGSTGGSIYQAMMPTDGDYVVRVYLMRAAAQRNETGTYSLAVEVGGASLPPLPAAQDALIRGTPFHASTTIPCTPPFETRPQQCEALVIRRGIDSTASVEVRATGTAKRRILFIKGRPVASDASEPMAFSRSGGTAGPATTIVKLGDHEQYEIPDPLLTGG